MTTTCPKCRYKRQPSDFAPDWQCPSCGVAYVKVADGGGSYRSPEAPMARTVSPETRESGWPWGKLLLFVLLVVIGWQIVQYKKGRREAYFGGKLEAAGIQKNSPEEIAMLAASVNPGEIIIYTSDQCPYAQQAKNWLQQNNFAFTECNLSTTSRCHDEYRSHGATGTPYLIVRGQHMRDGLNGEVFLSILRDR